MRKLCLIRIENVSNTMASSSPPIPSTADAKVSELERKMAVRDAEIVARDARDAARDAEMVARDAPDAARDAEVAALKKQLARQTTAEPPLSDSNECVIYLDGPRTTFVLPCKHLCLCNRCSANVRNCPIYAIEVAAVMDIVST